MQFDLPTFEAATQLHWLNASTRVLIINTVLGIFAIPPALAFTAAVNTPPSRQPDGSFIWIYTWVNQDQEVQIRLRGAREEDHVLWELRVTSEQAAPPLDEALWYWGEADLDNTGGFWIFNELIDPELPEASPVDWTVNALDDRQLAIEIIREGHELEGDRVSYTLDATTLSLVLFDASDELQGDITWDTVTGEGSIEFPNYNGSVRGCWDQFREDIPCPDGVSP
jgi:hypothetical protein